MRRIALIVVASTLVTACAEGRKPPSVTRMVSVTTGLTFYVGDTAPCTKFDQEPYACGTECAVSGDPGCVAIDGLGPPTLVELSPFCIDEHEVTNLQYLYCEATEKCPRREFDNLTNRIDDYGVNSSYDDFPANVIDYEAADAYCKSVGKRLPTAFEWERVAGGASQQADLSDKRIYPFLEAGDADAKQCTGLSVAINRCRNAPTGTTLAVKSSTDDKVEVSPGGGLVYDLGGNFREWTSTPYASSLGLVGMGLTCATGSRADCNPSGVISAPTCTATQSPDAGDQCCACGEPGQDCFRLCSGTAPELALCARRFPEGQTVSQDDEGWGPPASTFIDAHIVKGGSYDLSDTSFCQARSSAWSFQSDDQKTQISLGIRCAADVGTRHCPAP